MNKSKIFLKIRPIKLQKFNINNNKIILTKIFIMILICLFNKKNFKFKIIAITYANEEFEKQAKLNKLSALEIGKVDEHIIYGPNDIDKDFKEKNKDILSKPRGNGYWLWKPYFIYKAFKEKLKEGDYIIYTDSGILYMNSTYLVIDFLKKQNSEMWAIRLNYKERLYSKRDAFILMGVDMPFYSETYQYMAGVQIYRKSKYTEKFLEQLLFYSQEQRIILDTPNALGVENYQGFIDNRHDQTVLSLLTKKYGESNSGNPILSPEEINNSTLKLPNIFCIFRRLEFKNFSDLKEKCIEILKQQRKLFTN